MLEPSRYATLFGVAGAALGATALATFAAASGPAAWAFAGVQLYIGISFMAVALCYALNHLGVAAGPAFGHGAASPLVGVLLWPYRVGADLVIRALGRFDPMDLMNPVATRLYVGRLPRRSDRERLARAGVTAVLNLCAEAPRRGRSGVRTTAGPETAYLPVLDGAAPSPGQFRAALDWITDRHDEGHSILVHCAQGRGRSVAVAAAALCQLGLAEGLDDSLGRITSRNPGPASRTGSGSPSIGSSRPDTPPGIDTLEGPDPDAPPLRSVLIGEFLGTLLLVLLGDGVVASAVLLNKDADWVLITTGWAFAVTLALYVSGRLSGGHLNPAVTLALAVRGDVPGRRVPIYWAAQVAGAFTGAMLVYADYAAAFAAFEIQYDITRGELADGTLVGKAAGGAGVFATYPLFDGLIRNLFSEFLGTATLLFAVRAISDRRNASPGANLEPVLIGVVVWAIGLSLGGLTGYAINPARDLGPRLASSLLGWGGAVFTSHGMYFWVPIVAPLAGGVFGSLLYDLAISAHLPPAEEPSPPGRLSP